MRSAVCVTHHIPYPRLLDRIMTSMSEFAIGLMSAAEPSWVVVIHAVFFEHVRSDRGHE